jgi:hypothetical protein
MLRSNNPFAMLADRAETGDSSAQSDLRRKLEPEMICIVRRVIQQGNAHTAMDRRILAEARRLGLDTAGAEIDLLIRKVASSVSNLFVDRLRAKPSDRFRMGETVCN